MTVWIKGQRFESPVIQIGRDGEVEVVCRLHWRGGYPHQPAKAEKYGRSYLTSKGFLAQNYRGVCPTCGREIIRCDYIYQGLQEAERGS